MQPYTNILCEAVIPTEAACPMPDLVLRQLVRRQTTHREDTSQARAGAVPATRLLGERAVLSVLSNPVSSRLATQLTTALLL